MIHRIGSTPWKLSLPDDCIVINGHGACVADCSTFYQSAPEECEANARLIAAAPDMLDALQEFIRVANSEHNVTNRGVAYGLAVAAVAKAEGFK